MYQIQSLLCHFLLPQMATTTSQGLYDLLARWNGRSQDRLLDTICFALDELFQAKQIEEFYFLVKGNQTMNMVIDKLVYSMIKYEVTYLDGYKDSCINCVLLILLKCIKEGYFSTMAYHALCDYACTCRRFGRRIELAQRTIVALTENVGGNVEFWISKRGCENFVGALGTDDEIINRYWQIYLILNSRFEEVKSSDVDSLFDYFRCRAIKTTLIEMRLHGNAADVGHLVETSAQRKKLKKIFKLFDIQTIRIFSHVYKHEKPKVLDEFLKCMQPSTSIVFVGDEGELKKINQEFLEFDNLFVDDRYVQIRHDKFMSDGQTINHDLDLLVPRLKRVKRDTR
jgi:hypothetical protein